MLTMISRLGRSQLLLILFLAVFLCHESCSAQHSQPAISSSAISTPDTGTASAPVSSEPTAAVPSSHRFWDKENILLFSGVAVFRGLDYASTRNMQARGREEILIPDDVVNNSAGFASLEAAATMTSVGISYIFHRTGHHKLERWLSIGHIGVTAFGVARNYALKSKHPN
jgi:hypothetical protein